MTDATIIEDTIARQGTEGLRQAIALTEMINDSATKAATLERQVEQLRPKPDIPDEIVQIRRRAREDIDTYFVSVPVYIDTPGLN